MDHILELLRGRYCMWEGRNCVYSINCETVWLPCFLHWLGFCILGWRICARSSKDVKVAFRVKRPSYPNCFIATVVLVVISFGYTDSFLKSFLLKQPAQKNLLSSWQHDMFDEQMREAAPSSRLLKIETGTKLFVSNLDYGVSNEDIKELFSEVGDLKRSLVHYDRSGRSKGTAEVVFARRADAETAVKRYNNVQLDGKPLKLELIGTNIAVPVPNPLPRNGTAANAIPVAVRWRGRGGAFRGSRGRGRGRGGQWQRGEEKSVEDLDAELENYHAEAMQIN